MRAGPGRHDFCERNPSIGLGTGGGGLRFRRNLLTFSRKEGIIYDWYGWHIRASSEFLSHSNAGSKQTISLRGNGVSTVVIDSMIESR